MMKKNRFWGRGGGGGGRVMEFAMEVNKTTRDLTRRFG